MPSWVVTVMTSILETGWEDPETNNSDTVRYSYSTTNDVIVRYSTESIAACEALAGWLGCADATGSTYKIWIRSNPPATWCDKLSQPTSGCPDAGRAAIHEVAHIGGYLNHNPSSYWVQTRVQGNSPLFPFYDTNTWDAHTLGRCDEAALQLWYDVKSKSGPYADCLDHIPDAVEDYGLKTKLTAGPASQTVCEGQPATVTGRLEVSPAYDYGRVDGNALGGRTVTLYRNGSYYTTATATVGSGDNWSKVITQSFGPPDYGVYNFTAQFVVPVGAADGSMEAGLNSSPVKSFTINVLPAWDC